MYNFFTEFNPLTNEVLSTNLCENHDKIFEQLEKKQKEKSKKLMDHLLLKYNIFKLFYDENKTCSIDPICEDFPKYFLETSKIFVTLEFENEFKKNILNNNFDFF